MIYNNNMYRDVLVIKSSPIMRRITYFIPSLALCMALTGALTAKTPNIVMFLIDDQDMDQLATYGGDTYTPNLDRMAAEGIKFNQAYVSSSVCTPSRYTFLTGRYAGSSYDDSYLSECPEGQQGNILFNMGLEPDNMNVGAVLAANGYATSFVGKYHAHGAEGAGKDDEALGLQGLSRNAKDTPATSAIFRENELIYRKLIMERGFTWAKHIYWGNMNKPYSEHNPEWTMAAALEFIEANQRQPFYLHYCTTLLHGPNRSWSNSLDHPDVTGEGIVKADPKVMIERKRILEALNERGLDPKNHFGIAWMDANLGTLFDKHKELGIDDNTLVVFAPDHGSSDKGSLYAKNGTHIPMLMRWPAAIPAGIESDELVQNIDMVPTFFDLANARVPSGYRMDGMSLKPLLRTGKAPDGQWRESLYFEIGTARAIMTKDWKYISVRYNEDQIESIKRVDLEQLPRAMSPMNRTGIGLRGVDHPGFWSEDQLYNLSKDPNEMKNLVSSPEYAPKLRDLQQELVSVLQTFDRPYGEFIPGGNAAAPGQLEKQFELVKQLKIKGKDVVVPPGLK